MKHVFKFLLLLICLGVGFFGINKLANTVPRWVHYETMPIASKQANVRRLKQESSSPSINANRRQQLSNQAHKEQVSTNAEIRLKHRTSRQITKVMPTLLPAFAFIVILAGSTDDGPVYYYR